MRLATDISVFSLKNESFCPMQFLLATRNKGKIAEIRDLLVDAKITLVGLDELNIADDVEETGSTFAENAMLKASAYAQASGLHSIADDSGLEVAALDGRPGVYSARYGGVESSYDEKMRTLLAEIESTGPADRTARFVSHITIADPSGKLLFEAEGTCPGTIGNIPLGDNGFGYDPVFIPDGFEKTFGELGDEVKRTISHRSIAISKIIRFLRDFA